MVSVPRVAGTWSTSTPAVLMQISTDTNHRGAFVAVAIHNGSANS